MSATITLKEAQAKLKALIDNLGPGEEILITEDNKPVAKLVGGRTPRPPRPAPGLGKGSILFMAPDFDEDENGQTTSMNGDDTNIPQHCNHQPKNPESEHL